MRRRDRPSRRADLAKSRWPWQLDLIEEAIRNEVWLPEMDDAELRMAMLANIIHKMVCQAGTGAFRAHR